MPTYYFQEAVLFMCDRILLSHKKEWNNAICSNLDGPRDYHSIGKVSKTKRNIIWYHSHVESNFKNDANEIVYKAEADLTNMEKK